MRNVIFNSNQENGNIFCKNGGDAGMFLLGKV
jgi:hypothetical protein